MLTPKLLWNDKLDLSQRENIICVQRTPCLSGSLASWMNAAYVGLNYPRCCCCFFCWAVRLSALINNETGARALCVFRTVKRVLFFANLLQAAKTSLFILDPNILSSAVVHKQFRDKSLHSLYSLRTLRNDRMPHPCLAETYMCYPALVAHIKQNCSHGCFLPFQCFFIKMQCLFTLFFKNKEM